MRIPSELTAALHRLRTAFFFWRAKHGSLESEPALRDALFNEEQMARHGAELAAMHVLRQSPGRDRLLGRLDDNERVISACCKLFSAVNIRSKSDPQITPAGEWLLDNYWMVEEQIHTARKHLPKGYSRELPQLASGPSAGLPRVYDIALESISHGDGRLDDKILAGFVLAYESVSPLTLGELWAIPIMLRLALIENLRRVATRVMSDWQDQHLAAGWADRLIETAEKDRKSLVLAVADMASSNPPMTSAFVAELARRLQGQKAALSLPLNWIEELLAEMGSSVDRLIQQDTQQQAANQVSIRNSMMSLRLLAALDWREFVECISLVERTLRKDPAGIYTRMDFASRDTYRHAVERLARKYRRREEDVAQAALELAASSAHSEIPAEDVRRHVGYFLVDDGLPVLREQLGHKSGHGWLQGRGGKAPQRGSLRLVAYLGALLGFSLLLSVPFFFWLGGEPWLLLPGIVLVPLVLSEPALKLVNWLATFVFRPHALPRLDYGAGIPAESRTLVVVPSMIGDERDVADLLEKLEVHYLANRGGAIQFGLLTDFKDSDQEKGEADEHLLELAGQGIAALNRRYPAEGADAFFLCHRPRRWSAGEGRWIGFERKRGKLHEFNELAQGRGRDRFSLIAGNTLEYPQLMPVRYVITLDTDTLLPRDAARKLAGTMAHPLNRPVFDPDRDVILSGYAILQPRVAVTLPSSNRSDYARIFSNTAGLDPYTRSVSDAYQDIFRNGSYTGKGIYDLAAFSRALRDRLPDNRVLSHDLIEGSYARSGLVSDVLLFEDYPAGYSADVKRRHRWIRGDWQIARWMLPRVPRRDGSSGPNPLSGLSRWKICDNLRRSLVPQATVLFLLAGWFLSGQALLWTTAFIGALLLQPVAAALVGLVRKSKDIGWRQHCRAVGRGLGRQALDLLLWLVWLPHEAWYFSDAIVRTLWRIHVSRRHLLQWNPSADTERSSARSLEGLYREMAFAPIAGLMVFAGIVAMPGLAPLVFALLWMAAPAVACRLSRPRTRKAFVPDAEQDRFLRVLARKTWAFFERYVRQEDNWLPPDNLQVQPEEMVAHRTSPTNMGLALLAHLSAHDLGYLSCGGLLERLEHMVNTMSRLKRHRDHFYNWYNTQSLEPLRPAYVSTVDSGNLAGHLLVLRQGLYGLADEPVVHPRLFQGLMDTAEALCAWLPEASLPAWQAFVDRLEEAVRREYDSVPAVVEELRRLRDQFALICPDCAAKAVGEARGEVDYWANVLLGQCKALCRDLELFVLPGEAGPRQLPTLRQLAELDPALLPEAQREQAENVRQRALERISLAEKLGERAGDMARMDFSFLYDTQRELFSIGYSVDEQRLDASYYDLLASEARLTYFTAIAQGQIPQDAWFALGRLLTDCSRMPVLLSWSGSMFEYLMPVLVMPSYEGSLLDASCEGAVRCQIAYGRQIKRPWGISESGYFLQDAQHNYQYKAFGVPGLGLKRGLADETVLAPYASVMALLVLPAEACHNLQVLEDKGLSGRFGMYEAVDYTPLRLPRGREYAIIYSYMAHHQGMSLLALDGLLTGRPMQRRFLAEPGFQASQLLLEERMPKSAPEYLNTGAVLNENAVHGESRVAEGRLRVFTDPDSSQPGVQLLSNGTYHVMVSSSGGGYSRYGSLALSRWQEDATRDNWGMFCYVRDVETGGFWSTAYQPVCRRTETFEAIFSESRAEFRVREQNIDTHTEIVVSPEDDCELRRVHVTNRGRGERILELTSYGEIVLAPPLADAQHPAFSKLFVQTRLEPELQAILCTRRPRSSEEKRTYLFHLVAAHGVDLESVSYETDRSRFIGRGRDLSHPAAMDTSGPLSGTAGAVLDAVTAIRCLMHLEPGQTAVIDYVTGISDSEDGCFGLMHKFRDKRLADRVFDLGWTHSQVLLHQFNATLFEAHLYAQMAASIVYANPGMRADQDVLRANNRGPSGLWGQGISGDYPIVLLKISDSANIDLVTQMVKAHSYWRLKGLTVDLVIWNEDHISYRQNLHDLILSVIPSGMEGHIIDKPGGIFVRAAQQLAREDRILLQSVARLIFSDTGGSLNDQVYRRRAERRLPGLCVWKEPTAGPSVPLSQDMDRVNDQDALQMSNSLGGFTADGREYVIRLNPGETTPAPWANVLANPRFGSVVSESGSAYTWLENAHEFRLTPWTDDPVTDSCGEALYLRDEASGHYWSPTPLPATRSRRGGKGSRKSGYVIRHGFGYSIFEHSEQGIATELTVCVARDAPVKLSLLRIRNVSDRPRRLSVTGYVEWVLGDLRSRSAMHVRTEVEPATGCILARTGYTMDFPDRVAFFGVDAAELTFTCDRAEFLGRNGSPREPAAMRRACLSGRAGAGLDPCAAVQTVFDLFAGESRECVFILGAGEDTQEARELAAHFTDVQVALAELATTRAYWHELLDVIQVSTPDPAVNVLVNGGLLYQNLSSRFFGRSGYYQSGGAFGFRDQLQDSMAMVYACPQLVREHLLRSAAHQFVEGDVQHWWHPPLDRGVRTRISDDYLWLPLAVTRYVGVTRDTSVLDETVPYIEGRPLNPDEESVYDLPVRSELRESLYDHCVRAIKHGLRFGAHGLPLMGGGDWNDGMDRVGIHGRGESVWLGFFLYTVLERFAPLARSRGDEVFAGLCREEADRLRGNLEEHGWDGGWYRRAYFDDGTPLGSSANEECRIDSIAQSWSVLSGAAPAGRQQQAMDALDEHLVRRDLGIVQLFTPPFDHSNLDPGYIKGYVPGVRENGGQYTHAAVWAAMAFARLGDSGRAWELANMINPVRHGDSREAMTIYKVEPYVLAADVYAVAPHGGRGGWTWYTGSAAWMYRLLLESLLGIRVDAGRLFVTPLLPRDWSEAEVRYRFGSALYVIRIRQGAEPGTGLLLDGREQNEGIPLEDDGREHVVDVAV